MEQLSATDNHCIEINKQPNYPPHKLIVNRHEKKPTPTTMRREKAERQRFGKIFIAFNLNSETNGLTINWISHFFCVCSCLVSVLHTDFKSQYKLFSRSQFVSCV